MSDISGQRGRRVKRSDRIMDESRKSLGHDIISQTRLWIEAVPRKSSHVVTASGPMLDTVSRLFEGRATTPSVADQATPTPPPTPSIPAQHPIIHHRDKGIPMTSAPTTDVSTQDKPGSAGTDRARSEFPPAALGRCPERRSESPAFRQHLRSAPRRGAAGAHDPGTVRWPRQ